MTVVGGEESTMLFHDVCHKETMKAAWMKPVHEHYLVMLCGSLRCNIIVDLVAIYTVLSVCRLPQKGPQTDQVLRWVFMHMVA